MKVSGCPNSCGQHHVGDIGLTGHSVNEHDGTERPYYSILVGGSVGEGRGRVGQRLGRYREEDTPAAIAALAHFFEARRGSPASVSGFRRPRGDEGASAVASGAARRAESPAGRRRRGAIRVSDRGGDERGEPATESRQDTSATTAA